MQLSHLTDRVLLADTKCLVLKERKNLTTILFHLREIEKRKLYSTLGYSSLFEYAVKELGYSESSAMRRIHSARLLEEIPSIQPKIESGLLSLSNLSDASRSFNKENIKEPEKKVRILKKLEGKTNRECGKTLMDLFGPQDPLPKESIKPVSADTHLLKFLISEKTLMKLRELEGCLLLRSYLTMS